MHFLKIIEKEFKNLQDKIKKLHTFYSCLFISQAYFFDDWAHIDLIF